MPNASTRPHRTATESLHEELTRLMREQIVGLQRQTFGGIGTEELRQQEERLKRIREISAEIIAESRQLFISAVARPMEAGGSAMNDKHKVTLPGTVKKIIERPAEPKKAEISVEGADPLYQEIRIENTLEDPAGKEVELKPGAQVDIKIEADPEDTAPKKPKS